MNFDDEFSHETPETGSDELLSDDNLRLPDSASTLVRIHAIRAWLKRRRQEAAIEVGEAALAIQHTAQEDPQHRPRRREIQSNMERVQRAQQTFAEAQQRLDAYDEAETLLEDCVAHTTSGERVLVEYYLTLEELVQDITDEIAHSPRYQALADVQHRVEHVGAPNED